MKKEQPATQEELAAVQKLLSETPNDPNTAMLLCNCIPLDLSPNHEFNCEKCRVRLDFIKRNPNNIYSKRKKQ